MRGGPPAAGRAPMGRDPPAPGARLFEPGMGRRAPGGGGIGRPVALSGRPGGGGIGRPVALSGGRIGAGPPSLVPSPALGRCVGRMVVGPSGETVRVGTGLGAAARLRTTLGAGSAAGAIGAAASTGAVDCDGAGASAGVGAGASLTGATTRETRTGASGTVSLVDDVAFVALVDLVDLAASSGWTSRRSPSASARRRMRSAWASSMEAEGLEAPMPSFWASPSNSLLVRPSSFESSWTRIFFCAKTFP